MHQCDHYSVLLQESVDALVVNKDGVYLDGTFGRGGHSKAILNCLSEKGRLIAFDKDPEAIQVGRELEKSDSRFSIVHASFCEMQSTVQSLGLPSVDGVVLDLGVSSPQLDSAERGFSFMNDGPLDMRMDNSKGQTAKDWIATAEESDIAFVLREFGEERFSRRMARAIVEKRQEAAIERTSQLSEIVSAANPKWEKGKHPATRAFQAIRIFINRELDDLTEVLTQGISILKPSGRMVVISFHSLEDRIVKRFFKEQAKGKYIPASVPITDGMLDKKIKIIGKALKASEKEVGENVRSRSAVMRIAEKL